jgi:hypothetical protein
MLARAMVAVLTNSWVSDLGRPSPHQNREPELLGAVQE